MKLLSTIFLFFYIPFSNAQQLKETNIATAPSREILTAFNSAAKIVFEYDVAGNQTNVSYNTKTSSDINQSKDNVTAPSGKLTSLEIYPNPASQRVAIVSDFSEENKIAAIRLIASVTRVAKKLEFVNLGNTVRTDISQFPTGVYILEIEFKDGTILNNELIKI
ncbi:MAG: T9SS type A sorting domain-containing protein [Flavicella sp.]